MAHCSEGGFLKKRENLILSSSFLPNALANGVGEEGRWPHSCKVTATIHLDVHWEGEDVPSPFAILQWPKAIDDDATAALKKERKNTPLRTEFHTIIHAFCSVRSKAPRHSHGERGGPLFIKSRSPDSQMFSSSQPTFFRASHRLCGKSVGVCVPILSAGLLICCTVFFLPPAPPIVFPSGDFCGSS